MLNTLSPDNVRFGSFLWRDRLLIVFSWLVVIGIFLINWASQNYYSPSQLSRAPTWLLYVLYLHLLLVVVGLPIVHLGQHRSKAIARLFDIFQRPHTLIFLLIEFSIAQAVLLVTDSTLKEPSPAFLFAYLVFFLIFLWHVLGRETIDIGNLIITNIWMLLLSDTRSLIADPVALALYPIGIVAAVRVILWICFVPLIVMPILSLFPTVHLRLSRLRNSLTSFQMFMLLTVGAACFVPYAVVGNSGSNVFYWLGVIIAAPLVGFLVTKVKPTSSPQSWSLSTSAYRVCASAIMFGYLILAFLTAHYTFWDSNPDMYAYYQIARGYVEGKFPIRGYWSPLMSWALAIPMAFSVDPQFAERIGVILTGFAWIYASLLLAKRFDLNRLSRLALMLAMALFVLNFGFFPLAPDLLAATFTTFFFYLITDPRLVSRPLRFGIITGFVGALAYFTKYFNLPYLLVYLLVFTGILAVHTKQYKRVLLACSISLLTMVALVTPWTIAVSQRYGLFASSTDGLINRFTPLEKNYGHGCLFSFLCDQPQDVLFPWEDPLPRYYPDMRWSPFSSVSNFQLEIHALGVSLLKFVEQWPLGRLPLIAFASFVGGIFIVWKDNKKRLLFIWAFFTIFLQAAGYFYSGYLYTENVEMRFHFSIIPFLVVMVLYLVQLLFESVKLSFRGSADRMSRVGQVAITCLLALSFTPLQTTIQLVYGSQTAIPCEKQAAEAFKDQLVEPIVGTESLITPLSYYAQKRSYGIVAWPPSRISADYDAQLQTIGIQTPKTIDQVNQQLNDMKVKTLVTTEGSGLVSPLIAQFGYKLSAKGNFCNESIVVLQVARATAHF